VTLIELQRQHWHKSFSFLSVDVHVMKLVTNHTIARPAAEFFYRGCGLIFKFGLNQFTSYIFDKMAENVLQNCIQLLVVNDGSGFVDNLNFQRNLDLIRHSVLQGDCLLKIFSFISPRHLGTKAALVHVCIFISVCHRALRRANKKSYLSTTLFLVISRFPGMRELERYILRRNSLEVGVPRSLDG
jgi:hypothetical protein